MKSVYGLWSPRPAARFLEFRPATTNATRSQHPPSPDHQNKYIGYIRWFCRGWWINTKATIVKFDIYYYTPSRKKKKAFQQYFPVQQNPKRVFIDSYWVYSIDRATIDGRRFCEEEGVIHTYKYTELARRSTWSSRFVPQYTVDNNIRERENEKYIHISGGGEIQKKN